MHPPALRPLLLLASLLAAAPGHATTSLLSQSFSRDLSGVVEFSPSMSGPGATTSILRTFEATPKGQGSLLFQNQAAMTVAGYGGFSAAVSSTGDMNDYPVGTQGMVGAAIDAFSRATIADVVTVSGASGAGTLRMAWHLTGSVDVGWSVNGPVEDIDFGTVRLTFACFAQPVGTPTPDTCPDPSLTWTDIAAVDEIVNVEVPIVFDAPVQYTLTITLQSAIGTGPYTAGTGQIDFVARAIGGFGSTGTLVETAVLDAGGQPVAGSAIQSESGFQYDLAPEPGRGPLLACGGLVLAVVRRRRRA